MRYIRMKMLEMSGGAEGGAAGGTNGADGQTQEQGQQEQAARPSFDELIKGEYKDEYGRHVKAAIDNRFRNQADLKKQLDSYSPIARTLAMKYGCDPSDVGAIAQALEQDDSMYQERADKAGITTEALRQMDKLEAENQRYKATEEENRQRRVLEEHFQKITQEGEALKQRFPGFDLASELQNEEFVRLTSPQMGMSVEKAYYAIHGADIQRQSMQYAADQAAQRLAASVQAGAARPTENGIGNNAPVSMGIDINKMSEAQRAEIRRRLSSGEHVRL